MFTRRSVVRAFIGGALFGPAALTGCGSGGSAGPGPPYTRSAAVAWGEATLEAITATKPSPPVCSRALAIVHTCMFDAWAAYDVVAVGTQRGGSLRRPPAERTLANKQKAVSYAAYISLVDLFPTQISAFQTLMTSMGYDPNDASTDIATPNGLGVTCARAVIAFRHQDGSNQLGDLHSGAYSDYTGYVPVNDADHINDPNHWQPLHFSDGMGGVVTPGYITPHWGKVIPFALVSSSQFRAPAPAQAGSAEYLAQAQHLVDVSAALTDEQKVIAEYWKDGPKSVLPPGHWCGFGQFVAQRDRHNLDTDVKMYFILANAVLDAGIAVWETKRAYDSERPITAIHYLFSGKQIRSWAGPGKGTQTIDGKDWLPYQPATFITPPFPEHVSGHSAFSAASAEVLKRFTSSDHFGNTVTIPAGSSSFETGTPASSVTLSWPTFTDAANQAGISRIYGGIHFPNGDLNGRQMGRMVGAQVWDKAQTYIRGTAIVT